MKKIIVCMILIIFICSCKLIRASDIGLYVNWIKEDVYVPVNSNIDDYLETFEFKVYVDGQVLLEDKYEIKIGVDGTNPELINTAIPKIYPIKVRVIVLGYHSATNTHTVNYHVFDDEAPELVNPLSEITTKLGIVPDYKQLLNDNHFLEEGLIYEIFDKGVNYNKVSTYYVEIKISDKSGNYIIIEVTLRVVDTIKPYIVLTKRIVIGLNDIINPSDFMEGYDSYEKNITDNIIVDDFDNATIGTKSVKFTLSDLSGNFIEQIFLVYIDDFNPPIIEFNALEGIVDVKTELTLELFKSFISRVYDDGCELSIEDVDIDFSNVFNQIGVYNVYYFVEDYKGNPLTRTYVVRLVQLSGPIIECENITLVKGEVFSQSIVSKYIRVIDDYDLNAQNTLDIDFSNVNLNKKGVYIVTVSAFNSSGIYTYETFTITVVEEGIDLLKYWPIILLGVLPLGYFGYIQYKKIKEQKYQ